MMQSKDTKRGKAAVPAVTGRGNNRGAGFANMFPIRVCADKALQEMEKVA
jgi:hypothetical protein